MTIDFGELLSAPYALQPTPQRKLLILIGVKKKY